MFCHLKWFLYFYIIRAEDLNLLLTCLRSALVNQNQILIKEPGGKDSNRTQSQLLGSNLPLPLRKDPLYQAPWAPQSCGFSFHWHQLKPIGPSPIHGQEGRKLQETTWFRGQKFLNEVICRGWDRSCAADQPRGLACVEYFTALWKIKTAKRQGKAIIRKSCFHDFMHVY